MKNKKWLDPNKFMGIWLPICATIIAYIFIEDTYLPNYNFKGWLIGSCLLSLAYFTGYHIFIMNDKKGK